MATAYIDPRHGDDSNDGLSESQAVKTMGQARTVAGINGWIIMMDGVYRSSVEGKMTAGYYHKALNQWAAVINHDQAGPYITGSGTGDKTVYARFIMFRDFSDSYFLNNFSGSNNDAQIELYDCYFDNCGKIIEDGTGRRNDTKIKRCIFRNCGGGAKLFDSLDGTGSFTTVVNDNVFAGCNNGSSAFLSFDGAFTVTEGALNNIFKGCTGSKYYNFSAMNDAAVSTLLLDFNFYDSDNSMTNFATTTTGTKADLATWQTDTNKDANAMTGTAGFLDYSKGLLLAASGGNLDRTGSGRQILGAIKKVGKGWSGGLSPVTMWDNATLDGGVPARGTLTLAVQPTNGDTFTLDSKTYTLQDSLTDSDGNIEIGVDLATTQGNIYRAINLLGGGGYAPSMTEHPTVWMHEFSANDAICQAKVGGTGGNSIASTETFNSGSNFFDAATLGTTRAGVNHTATQPGGSGTKFVHSGNAGSWERIKLPNLDMGENFDMDQIMVKGLQDGLNDVIDMDLLNSRMNIEWKTAANETALDAASFEKVNVGEDGLAVENRWAAVRVTLIDNN